MPRLVQATEASAARRRVYFQLVGTDGITPATGEAGGQPQVSYDGKTTIGGPTVGYTDTGVGTLTHIGSGRYYADLTTAAVATAGTEIETRYKSASTAECPGDSVQVVSFDPVDTLSDIRAKTDQIGPAAVTVSAPVDPSDGNRLTLTQGDDHTAGDRLPSWAISNYTGPSLADGTAKLRLLAIADYQTLGANAPAALEVTATVSQSGSTVTVTAAVTAAQSALLATYPPGDQTTHQYQLVATTSGGLVTSLLLGPATISRRIDPAS
jgi:hypothetical protein